MDILYYSNYCKHSTKVLQYIIKNSLINNLNCICVDKRKKNINTGIIMIILDNGKQINIPPNISSVPSLLCIKKKYLLISGDEDIIGYINSEFLQGNGSVNENVETPSLINETTEPTGVFLQTTSHYSNVISEQYTSYSNNTNNSNNNNNNTVHYVSLDDMYGSMRIKTPEDTYKPDKLSDKVTIDTLQKQRNIEIPEIPKTI